MRPSYKKIKVLAEHCPKCGEQLEGNNSMAHPWKCSCGVWTTNKYPFTGEYEVVPEAKEGED